MTKLAALAFIGILIAAPVCMAEFLGESSTWDMGTGEVFSAGQGVSWPLSSTSGYLYVTGASPPPAGAVSAAISVSGTVSLQDLSQTDIDGYVVLTLGWYDCSNVWHYGKSHWFHITHAGHSPVSLTEVLPATCPSANPVWVGFQSAQSGTYAILDDNDWFELNWQAEKISTLLGSTAEWRMPAGQTFDAFSDDPYNTQDGYLEADATSGPQGTLPAAVSLSGSVSHLTSGVLTSGQVGFELEWYDCTGQFHRSVPHMFHVSANGHSPFAFTEVVPSWCPSQHPIWIFVVSDDNNNDKYAEFDSNDDLYVTWQSND